MLTHNHEVEFKCLLEQSLLNLLRERVKADISGRLSKLHFFFQKMKRTPIKSQSATATADKRRQLLRQDFIKSVQAQRARMVAVRRSTDPQGAQTNTQADPMSTLKEAWQRFIASRPVEEVTDVPVMWDEDVERDIQHLMATEKQQTDAELLEDFERYEALCEQDLIAKMDEKR
jgi:hypothetical protein